MVRICSVSLKIWKISNVTVEILRIYEDYMTTTMFTLMLQNGLLVLVAPHFQNQKKKRRNVETRVDCLFEVFKYMSARKEDGARTAKVHPQNPFGGFFFSKSEGPGGGGTPIYGLFRYVPRNRVWFLRLSVLKWGIFFYPFVSVPLVWSLDRVA